MNASEVMEGDIQFVADSFLLEKTFQILAEADDNSLRKQAFDLGSVLSGVGDSIKSFVGSQIHGQDSGGVTRTVVNFLSPAIFFRLHPLLGMLVTAAQLFGFDLYSVFQRIVDAIMPSLQAGQPVSAQQINDIAKSSIPAMATASDDLFEGLRELHKSGKLTKESIKSQGSITDFFSPQKKQPNAFYRMFEFLSPARRGSLIVGILGMGKFHQ